MSSTKEWLEQHATILYRSNKNRKIAILAKLFTKTKIGSSVQKLEPIFLCVFVVQHGSSEYLVVN